MPRTAILALLLAPMFGQSFEVASIKPANVRTPPAGKAATGTLCLQPEPRIEGHRVTIPPANLCGLIRAAYDVQPEQIAGIPSEVAAQGQGNLYEIVAQAEEGRALTLGQVRAMLQSLLAERFGLKLRRELSERPVYLLTVDRGGSRVSTEPMRGCVNGRPPPTGMRGGFGFGSCEPTYTMASLVESLLRNLDRPLIDRTGLTGQYSFFLQFSRTAPKRADAPPELPTALQEQLGLRLEASRVPVEVLVVETVHRPSEN